MAAGCFDAVRRACVLRGRACDPGRRLCGAGLPARVGPGTVRLQTTRSSVESVQEFDVILRIPGSEEGGGVVRGDYSRKSVCVEEARAFFSSAHSLTKSGIETDFIMLPSGFD